MIHFSSVYTATEMRLGAAFSARQYPRQAFDNLIDPVLNIDWFEMRGPTFPPHPHAGFSAVTFLFADSPNGFINRDSFGAVQDIRPGGLHWSRASRGMMHEETPVPGAGPVRGLQIFINLPAASQADPAAAFAIPAGIVKRHSGKGWEGRVAVDGTTLGESAKALPSPVRIEEISLVTSALRDLDVPAGWGGILIVLEGSLSIGEVSLDPAQAIGFAADVDEQFRIAAPLDAAGGSSAHSGDFRGATEATDLRLRPTHARQSRVTRRGTSVRRRAFHVIRSFTDAKDTHHAYTANPEPIFCGKFGASPDRPSGWHDATDQEYRPRTCSQAVNSAGQDGEDT